MEKKKRDVWGDVETDHMLSIIKNRKILDLLDGKRYRNLNIFTIVEEEMKIVGFNKTAIQIRTKFKALKALYYKTKRVNNTSGAAKISCPHYEKLDEILSDRPACIMETGVDTSRPACIMETGVGTSYVQEFESGDEILYESQLSPSSNDNEIDYENIQLLVTTDSPSDIETGHQDPPEEIEIRNRSRTTRTLKSKKQTPYKRALAEFNSEFQKSTKTMQEQLLHEQQYFMEKEAEKQRKWEIEILDRERIANENFMTGLMNSFFHNLRSIMPYQNSSTSPYIMGMGTPGPSRSMHEINNNKLPWNENDNKN